MREKIVFWSFGILLCLKLIILNVLDALIKFELRSSVRTVAKRMTFRSKNGVSYSASEREYYFFIASRLPLLLTHPPV